MSLSKEEISGTPEQQSFLYSQATWKRVLGWANSHKKDLSLWSLPLVALGSVAYDTIVNHGGNFSLDNYLNLRSAEAQAVHDPIIDLTAPTFLTEGATAILGATWWTSASNPTYIKNTKLIGVFVGFPDQTQGLADLQSGKYSTAYLNKAKVVPDFYNHFLGFDMTLQTIPPIIMDHPWAYYDYDGTTWPAGKILQELVNRNLLTERYDGTTYPVYQIFDAHNPGVPERMGGTGGSHGTWGVIATQGNMLIDTINNDYNIKKVLLHENGHAFSLGHNTSDKSIMNPATDVDLQPTLLVDRFDIAQITKPPVKVYKNYLPVINRNSN